MTIFSPEIEAFLKKYTDPDSEDVIFSDQQEMEAIIAPMPNLTSRYRIGDIILFEYTPKKQPTITSERVTLVVGSKSVPAGIRRTRTTHGIIVACFRLEYSSTTVIDVILKTLYKNRKELKNISQKVKEGLYAVLGKGVYRTYRLDRMQHCWKLNLTKAQEGILKREEQEKED